MKFEHLYGEATATDRFEFEYSFVTKDLKLGQCMNCGSFTRWLDTRLQKHVCSQECGHKVWETHAKQPDKMFRHEQLDLFKQSAELELAMATCARPAWKDIIVIVRDQLPYLKTCVESVREHTHDFTLFIWDNGSGPDTVAYLHELQKEHASLENSDWDIEVWRSEDNLGFIRPNNDLAAMGSGDYIILLNSDTKVFEHWDTAMVGWLQNNQEVAQVGYWGGHLGPDGRGFGGDNGYDVDYIPGWCFCISRETYTEHGLFNKQLQFAYCEDADLSLRLQEAGRKLYALHAPLVYHYQNKTIKAVEKEGQIDVRASFDHNHKYIQMRWREYLSTRRVLLKRKDSHVNTTSELIECPTG